MAWEFLKPILTPNALATVQANPIILAYLLGWFLALIAVCLLAWYISFVTGKPYKKPKRPRKDGVEKKSFFDFGKN
jgi:hypothetical protein